ncbi:MAG: DoxX family protein [Betaproteobacteria bacterium]|nr:DoxX family protein [Betaproteobacteria bacterium]MDH3436030.1 DoxX family protein [Betaproteobacteria bacterium]
MSIAASAFDLSNGAVVLRLICALFFFPHIYFKVVGNPPPALGFFVKAGFKPPVFYMRLAIVVETVAALGLLFAIYTPWAALLAAASLAVAAVAVCFFNGSVKWLWNLGGMEFCVFWAIACVAVAMLYWN